jgi:hypothetical protein
MALQLCAKQQTSEFGIKISGITGQKFQNSFISRKSDVDSFWDT